MAYETAFSPAVRERLQHVGLAVRQEVESLAAKGAAAGTNLVAGLKAYQRAHVRLQTALVVTAAA